MMEKTVYCIIGERCKHLKYTLDKNTTDAEMIRSRLKQECLRDSLLDRKMKNNHILLQIKDARRNNQFRDLEEDEVIANNIDVNVVLIPIEETITSSDILNAKVIMIEEAPKVQEDETLCTVEEENNSSNTANSSLQQENVEQQRKTTRPSRLPLPPLTVDLKKIISETGITAANQHKFIAFWGGYLYNETDGTPSRDQYGNLASDLVAEYPELSAGLSGNGLVRTQLSSWIRNHRRNLKAPENRKGTKRDQIGNPKPKLPSELAVALPSPSNIEMDIPTALKELEKDCDEDVNILHVKSLLQITLHERRKWIENEADRITHIIIKYPALKHYKMIFFELLSLKNLAEATVFDRIEIMMNKLLKYFSLEGNDDRSKSQILTQLYRELTSKKLAANKNITPLFIVKEAMSSTLPLTTKEHEAPRAVIYIEKNTILKAYIVADENVMMEIRNPSMENIIIGIISAYFVWHRKYPPAYSNILRYIEHELFGTKICNKSIAIL